MLPNLIIAGAPKCGTSSLFEWLKDHPDVCSSKRKETCFFMDTESIVFRKDSNYNLHGKDKYKEEFDCGKKNPKIVFEATPAYLYQETALKNIHTVLPECKILFILREPVSRLISTYNYFRSNRPDLQSEIDFGEFISLIDSKKLNDMKNELVTQAVDHGRYIQYLSNWKNLYGDKIIIVLYEDLVKDSRQFMTNISDMLGIDPTFYSDYSFKAYNKSITPRFKKLHILSSLVSRVIPFGEFRTKLREQYFKLMDLKKPKVIHNEYPDIINLLKKRYQVDNEQLSTDFNIDLSSWNLKKVENL